MKVEQLLDQILEHYGTKGMKWGVRKSKVPKSGPSAEAKSAHRHLIKATVSGPQALTNKQLKEVNERLNLEQNFQRLSYNPSKAKQILDTIFKTGKSVNEAIEFANSPTGKALRAGMAAPPGQRGAAAKGAAFKTAEKAAKAAKEAKS
jgi:hypothetical protein